MYLPGPNVSFTLDQIRYEIFNYMRRELDLALDSRASEITFDEIREVRRVWVIDDLIKGVEGSPRIPDLKVLEHIFERLDEIKWLKLPERRGKA